MKRERKLLLIFGLGLLTIPAIPIYSQTIEKNTLTFHSLENTWVKVAIELDVVNEKITLTLNPEEILCIAGYKGLVERVNVVDDKFISLSFHSPGGSEVGMEQTVLVCVSNEHLYKSLDIISKESDFFGYFDHIYKINFIDMQEPSKDTYKYIATQYDYVKSTNDSDKNHETLDILRFNFDKNRVFYNTSISLKGSYTVINNPSLHDSSQEKETVFKEEKYSGIALMNTGCSPILASKYLFIDGFWYYLYTYKNKKYLAKEWDLCNY